MAKITDPSKLLPSAKTTAITKIGKANFTSPLKIAKKSTSITKGLLGESNQKDAVDVNNKLVKVEKFFQSDLLVSKKKAETKRKEKEKEDFKKEEEKLEAPKEAKKFNFPSLSLPGMSFLDRIKRFLFFTALGWIFTRFQDQLPKLLGVVKLIGGVYGVAEDLFGKMFNGFMSLVKFGGDLKKQTLGFIASARAGVGGNYQKEFDKLEKQFNTFVNASIIAGVLAADIGFAAADEYKKWKGKEGQPGGRGYTAGYAAGFAAGLASRGKGPRYRAPGEAAAGRTLAENVARQKLTKERMLKPEGPKGPLDRVRRGFRGAAAQLETGTLFKRGAGVQKAIYQAPGKIKNLPKKIPAFWNKLFKGPFAKLKGPLSKFAGAAVPGLGAAIGAADAKARFKAGDKVGGTLASVSAALDVATAASALTGIGLPVAGILGTISIGIDVLLLIRDIVKAFFPFIPMFSRGGRVVGRYQGGGSVTRGGKPQGRGPSRTLKITKRRPPKIKPKQSQPGKDVGGKKKIRELYPDPSVRTDIEGEQKGAWWNLLPPLSADATAEQKAQREAKIKALPNPYKALTNTAKVLKDIPFGIGALMGGAVDIALGQKLPKDAIKGLSGGISYLITSIANRQISSSVSNIEKEVSKMQAGGVVRARDFTKGSEVGPGEGITKALDNLIYQKVDEAIREVQKQLMPGKYSEKGPNVPTPTPDTRGTGTPRTPTTPSSDSEGGGGGTGRGLNEPNVTGKSGYKGSTNVVDTGLKDYKGRAIKLNPGAAKAFKDMIAAGMPFKSGEVTSVYRDEAEYLRLVREGYNPSANSAHNYGEGADIQGSMGEWIKKNGSRYGWYYTPYPGQSHQGHFEWRGAPSTPQQRKTDQPPGQLPEIFKQKPKPTQPAIPPIFQLPGQTSKPGQPPGQQPKAKKSYNGLTSFYGTSGNEPEKPPRDGFGYDPGKKTTASGQPFIPSGLTAAHKTLPFGTKLRVTNPNNGKSVVVTVNDRGPYSGNRVLDLSYGAAKAIGMIGSGQINAKIEELKGGGYIPKQSPNRNVSSLRSYPSYADGGMMIAIQPHQIIVEKPIFVPMGRGGGISFPIAGVNNSTGNTPSLNKG